MPKMPKKQDDTTNVVRAGAARVGTILDAEEAKRPKVKKLTAAIGAVLDALDLPPRIKLKILADCAERIYGESLGTRRSMARCNQGCGRRVDRTRKSP